MQIVFSVIQPWNNIEPPLLRMDSEIKKASLNHLESLVDRHLNFSILFLTDADNFFEWHSNRIQ